MNTLLSFHSDPSIKEKYLHRLKLHAAADEIVQRATGHGGKGCAVWCTLDRYEHQAYETELGIPRIIAHLEDRIFEGLPVEESKAFPADFLNAIPVGKDLQPVWRFFFIWLLTDPATGVIRHAKLKKTKDAIQAVSDLFTESLTRTVGAEEFEKVRYAAAAADAYGAAYAAYAAAYAAAAAAAADKHNRYRQMAAKLIELLKAA